jgi:hypothetical protein
VAAVVWQLRKRVLRDRIHLVCRNRDPKFTVVFPGLVPGINLSACSGVRGWLVPAVSAGMKRSTFTQFRKPLAALPLVLGFAVQHFVFAVLHMPHGIDQFAAHQGYNGALW